ncbi:MAG: glycosyltransferase [Alphaproteobacteria bacterium]|nr:glycosyltransferase [Alphaproteobacteria bacterium]
MSPAGTLSADDLPAILEKEKPPAGREAPATDPSPAGRLLRDAKQAAVMKRFARYARAEVMRLADRTEVPFVLTRHVLFGTAGLEASRAIGRPLVTWAHASLVHEAATWGTNRWFSTLTETLGERYALSRSDAIVAVTQKVLQDLSLANDPRACAIGNGTELSRFDGEADRRDRIVWVGSFRRFHGVERVVEAFAAAGADGDLDAELVLVGRGPRVHVIERRVRELGLEGRVTFPGFMAPADLPALLLTAKVGVVAAGLDSEDFHYSPVKLREYAAAGLVGCVPAIGEMAAMADEPWVEAYRNTAEGLADGMKRALARATTEASDAARAYARAHYGWDRWWHATRALLASMR